MTFNLQTHLKAVVAYLGDAAHRRFVSAIIAIAATHLVGHAIGGDEVATTLDLIVGGLAGAWSRTTPQVDVPSL